MTKRNVVWLITKLIGVYFAYWTIVAVFVLIGSVYTYISLPSPPRFPKADSANTNTAQTISPNFPGNPTNPAVPVAGASPTAAKIETPIEKAKNDALKQLIWDLLLTVMQGLVAWYLLRDGRFLVALLNREDPFDESGKPLDADAFPLSKKKDEVVTTLNLSGGASSSGRKDEITSLNLSDVAREPVEQTAPAAPAAGANAPAETFEPAGEPTDAPVPPPVSPAVEPIVSNEAAAPPLVSPEPSLHRPSDFEDDALIEELNINPPGERK